MKKLNWKNIGLAILFILAIGVIGHDLYLVGVKSIITGTTISWTWFGFITFGIAVLTAEVIYQYFEDYTK